MLFSVLVVVTLHTYCSMLASFVLVYPALRAEELDTQTMNRREQAATHRQTTQGERDSWSEAGDVVLKWSMCVLTFVGMSIDVASDDEGAERGGQPITQTTQQYNNNSINQLLGITLFILTHVFKYVLSLA